MNLYYVYAWCKMYYMILSTVSTVSFEQRAYSVDEYVGSMQPVLIFSKPSSYNITVQVLAGECWLANLDHM